MQGNHFVCKEFPSGAVGWVVTHRWNGGFWIYNCAVPIPEVLAFLFSAVFLSLFPLCIFMVRLWNRIRVRVRLWIRIMVGVRVRVRIRIRVRVKIRIVG